MIDLVQLQKSLTPERIIELVTLLGADRYDIRKDYIIFPTICHNINTEEASMKLYYYFNSNMFVCYTDCGESFNIYELFKKRYELLNKEYNFFKDIVLIIADGLIQTTELNGFYNKYESKTDKYNKKKINSFRVFLSTLLISAM